VCLKFINLQYILDFTQIEKITVALAIMKEFEREYNRMKLKRKMINICLSLLLGAFSTLAEIN
jgi:hypothetical protein